MVRLGGANAVDFDRIFVLKRGKIDNVDIYLVRYSNIKSMTFTVCLIVENLCKP